MYRCHLLLLRLNVSPPIQLLQTQTKLPNIADDVLYQVISSLFTAVIVFFFNGSSRILVFHPSSSVNVEDQHVHRTPYQHLTSVHFHLFYTSGDEFDCPSCPVFCFFLLSIPSCFRLSRRVLRDDSFPPRARKNA